MGFELSYTAQLIVQPVRGFENGGHHFPAAELSLPAVSEPPAMFPPLLTTTTSVVACRHLASLQATPSCIQHSTWSLALPYTILSMALLHVHGSNAAPTGSMLE